MFTSLDHIFMKGTITVPPMAPTFKVFFPPSSRATPRSRPGDKAPFITLMQCIQRTQQLLSMRTPFPSSDIARVGQRVMTLLTRSLIPCCSIQAETASVSTWMASRQIPITAMSARKMELVQSLGHPENLNLNL